MTEGKVEIFLSHKEPEYRDNLLWLRPYLNREGYELLYYGAKGWTPLIDCCNQNVIIQDTLPDNSTITPIPPIEDIDYDECSNTIETIADTSDIVIEYEAPIPERVVIYTPCNCKNKK